MEWTKNTNTLSLIKLMTEYLDLLDNVLRFGTPSHGEKPEGSISVTGVDAKYDLRKGFPLLTCRDMSKTFDKYIVPELLWILSGSSNADDLEQKFGCNLWQRWAEDSRKKLGTPKGELGRIYGPQLRNWCGHTDQLKEIVEMLKRTPETRRAKITYWNLDDVEIGGVKKVNIAPCVDSLHFSQRNYREQDGSLKPRLDLVMNHRSADIPAGVPCDVAEYAILLMLVAREVSLEPGTLTNTIDDGQIYDVQIEKVKQLLEKPEVYQRPRVTLTTAPILTNYSNIEKYLSDFQLHDYRHGDKLFMPTVD